MKQLLLLLLLLLVVSQDRAIARDMEFLNPNPPFPGEVNIRPFTLRDAVYEEPFSSFAAALLDTVTLPRPSRLMPQNSSIIEKGLWGEEGILRSIGIASPLTPISRASELQLRRGMLTAHQIGGFITLGFMVSAVVAGQKMIDGNWGYRPYHRAFVTGTIISYSATALLALLSPPPLIRRDEVSTTTIHKTLAWIHVTGMILTPILGKALARNWDASRERIHQLSGYITTATFAASMITVTF